MTAFPWPDGPVIETERLRLRPHRLADLDARVAMTSDPETMRFVGGPQDGAENFSRLLRYAGHWALLGLVEERVSGRVAGEAGLGDFRRNLGSDFDGVPEAAWIMAGWAAGRGYASEAIAAAIAWHEGGFGPGRKVCLIDPGNIASLRVAQKASFVPFREAAYKDKTVILRTSFDRPHLR